MQKLVNIPDRLFMEEVNPGPTALDGLPNFFHFRKIEIAPMRISRRTNADNEIIAIVLTFIFRSLLNFAVIGRSPPLAVGPLPM